MSLEKFVHKLPKRMVLGNEKLQRIYNESDLHEFNTGDVLVLKKGIANFGIRPVAVVIGYSMVEDFGIREGKYTLMVTSDELVGDRKKDEALAKFLSQSSSSINDLASSSLRVRDPWTGEVVRSVRYQDGHFKWNIEKFFKKVPPNVTQDEALKFYEGRNMEDII